MDFKVYKSIAKKPILWMGAVAFTSILVGIGVIFLLPISKYNKVIFSSETLLNIILIYLITCLSIISKSKSTLLFKIIYTKDESDKVQNVEFGTYRYLDFFIGFFTLGVFFIEITSYSMISKLSFGVAMLDSIGLFIPICLFNVIFMYLHFYLTKYLLNQSSELKDNAIKIYEEKKKKRKTSE